MTDRLSFPDDDGVIPPRAEAYGLMQETAAQLLAQREQAYPRLVTEGRINQVEADQGLAAIRAVVAQWRMIVAGEDLPHPGDYRDALGADPDSMRATLEQAAARIAAIAGRTPADAGAAQQAHLVATLLWHQRPYGAYPRIWIAHDFEQSRRHRSHRRAA